jgi:hypothetical protein
MRRARWIVAVVVAALAAASYVSMPPAARTLPASPALRAPIRGAMHIHTRRSDGFGSVDDVASAAAQAGLNFVILTDHGDGTRDPDPPRYRSGVLCIDAVEISTDGGHLVALGIPRTTYSLGGEARDVVEDVKRMGGMAIAAHPASTRAQLRWTDRRLNIDGLEWMNADSEWRDESVAALVRTVLTYPFRRPESLAAMLDRPEESLRLWDELSTERPVVAIAAADAHARVPLTGLRDPYNSRFSLHVPGYEHIFRAFSIAIPGVTLTGEAKADAQAVLDAIRRGRVFSSIDALAGPVAFSFSAAGADGPVAMGEDVVATGTMTFQAQSNAPDGARLSLLRNGAPVHTASGAHLEFASSDPGVYRVEAQWPGAPGEPPVPWVVSNPIYVLSRPRPVETVGVPLPPKQVDLRYSGGAATDWHIENSPRSRGALDVVSAVNGTHLLLRYALGGTEDEGPFVAASLVVPQGLAGYDRLIFTAQSSRPTRIWIQLRIPSGGPSRSWRRSVFVDEMPRVITVPFAEMGPLDATTTGSPVLADVRDVLFVVDTIHTRPGMNGQLWLDDVQLGR